MTRKHAEKDNKMVISKCYEQKESGEKTVKSVHRKGKLVEMFHDKKQNTKQVQTYINFLRQLKEEDISLTIILCGVTPTDAAMTFLFSASG